MPIVAAALLLLVTAWLVVSFFRVRCPEGCALIVMRRGQLQGQPPEVTFVTEGSVFRTPSVAAIHVLNLRVPSVEAFAERTNQQGNCIVFHAEAAVQVGISSAQLQRAASRISGMSLTELGNVVEGSLNTSLCHAMYQQPVQFAACVHAIEAAVRSEFSDVLASMGLVITDLKVHQSSQQPYRCVYRKLGDSLTS